MSVELQEQRVRYVGNGTAKNFPFGFTIEEPSQVQVVRADAKGAESTLVLHQDYTVALGADGTGSVTLNAALPTGYVLALVSNIEIDQERAFYNNTPYYQEQIEGALDKLTRICQQIDEQVGRAVTVPPTSSETPAEFMTSLFTARNEAEEARDDAESARDRAEAAQHTTEGIVTSLEYLALQVASAKESAEASQSSATASQTSATESADSAASAASSSSAAAASASSAQSSSTTALSYAERAEQAMDINTGAVVTMTSAEIKALFGK